MKGELEKIVANGDKDDDMVMTERWKEKEKRRETLAKEWSQLLKILTKLNVKSPVNMFANHMNFDFQEK